MPTTLAFDFPTVDAIVAHVASMIGSSLRDGTAEIVAARPPPPRRPAPSPPPRPQIVVHLVSFSVTAPRGSLSSSPSSPFPCFAASACVDCTAPAPPCRWDPTWDVDGALPAGLASSLGDSVAWFDAPAFGLAQAEALRCDPQQRLLLGDAATAFANLDIDVDSVAAAAGRGDAGRSATAAAAAAAATAALRGRGVFVGLSQVEYPKLLSLGAIPPGGLTATGAHLAVAAGRVSFTFGLTGPSLVVDTACSASLVAAHLAAASVGSGEAPAAAAAGANLLLDPAWSIACARAGMLSPDGRCKALVRAGRRGGTHEEATFSVSFLLG